MLRTKYTFFDAVCVAVVLLFALLLLWRPWSSRQMGSIVIVSTEQGSEEYSLFEDRELEIVSKDVSLTIVIKNGEVQVKHSTCPDGVCVASGRISQEGETVVCAPAGVRITVKGASNNVDFIAG